MITLIKAWLIINALALCIRLRRSSIITRGGRT